jgi:hypothetical protein
MEKFHFLKFYKNFLTKFKKISILTYDFYVKIIP